MEQYNLSSNINPKAIDDAINRLRGEVHKRRADIKFIVPVLFGGLYPAWSLQTTIDKALVTGLKVDGGYDETTGKKVRPASVLLRPLLPEHFAAGRGLLIVDDIIGSGESLQKVLEIYPEATVAVATYWPSGREKFACLGNRLILGQELPQGQYVNFPWEKSHPNQQAWLRSHHVYAEQLRLTTVAVAASIRLRAESQNSNG